MPRTTPTAQLIPVGNRVAVRAGVPGGLPKTFGTGSPLADVVAVGPVNYRVRLCYDGSEHYVAHELTVDNGLPYRPAQTRSEWQAKRDAERRQAEELRLAAEAAELELAEAPAEAEHVVIVPCGGAKLEQAAPAGELYVGSYHKAARRAAARLGGRTLILSAKYGLLELDTVIEPYELTLGQPGSITAAELEAQAADLGILDATVTVLAGARYAGAALDVWPTAATPLVGLAGMGYQLAELASIAAGAAPRTTELVEEAGGQLTIAEPGPRQLSMFAA